MEVPKRAGKERIAYKGRIVEIVKQPMLVGGKRFDFELARRSPGVRLLIVKNNKILLTKEFRTELKKYDYRLPGGKVFDTIEEYHSALKKKGNVLVHALSAARRECREETGVTPIKIKHIHTSEAGATISWDLFYFLVSEFKAGKQSLGSGEAIYPEWHSFAEVEKMCLDGKIHEDRSVAVLLRFLLSSK